MVFDFWNTCNNNCIMCCNPLSYQSNDNLFLYPKNLVIDKIRKHKESIINSKDNIHITGGEPTIYPYFFEILEWINSEFKETDIALVTNGRMLSYDSFTKRLSFIKNLTTIQISLHGYNDITHDSITRVNGSFNQTIKGINNLIKHKQSYQKIEIRTVLIRKNYRFINQIYEKIFELFPSIDIITLIFNEVEGSCEKNFKTVAVRYKDCNKIVGKVANFWGKKFKDFRLYHFPLCVLDNKYWGYAWRTLQSHELTFLKSCNKCLYKKYCMGIHCGYIDAYDCKEFIPIKKKISLKLNDKDNFELHPIINKSN